MSENVKIYEIARKVGISSTELVKICQRAGFDDITHHSNAVGSDQAEEIRKAAIRLYRPEHEPAKKTRGKKKVAEKKEDQAKGSGKKKGGKKRDKIPTTEHIKPVAPPKPRGRRVRKAEKEKKRQQKEATKTKEEKAKKEKRSEKPKGKKPSPKTRRTVVFKQPKKTPQAKKIDRIVVTPPVTVRTLSEKMGVGANDIIKKLMLEHQIRANINQDLDSETVELLALSYGIEVEFKSAKSGEERLKALIPEDKPEDMESRPPVVGLLGHVDHGKTSILDQIRHTTVAGTEDGGITQDVGAWRVQYDGHDITFVDTPGHEAFTAMRARGAQVTDVVILVVAADDGVMAQTEEAISHARAAGVPVVVALNKIDKPDANLMKAMQQLAGHGLNPEEWGGDVGCVQVSAITGQGVDELLERTLLEAELLEPQANPHRRADGVVLEARMQEGLGVVANGIIRNGTLKRGDIVVCGPAYGRVRSMLDQNGDEINAAGPSTPVAVSGLNRVPEAGEKFVVLDNIDTASQIAEEYFEQMEEERRRPRAHITLENLYESLQAGEEQQLRLVVKGDVKGSLAPLVNSLEELGNDEVTVNTLHRGVGAVNVSDVLLADASDAVILAFRVGIEEQARRKAQESGVEVRYFRVIYEAIQDVKRALEGLLKPEVREVRVGMAEVRATFKVSRVGTIAGCYVRDGKIRRNCRVRLVRDGRVIHEGGMGSLKREKDDVREVESGYECGINIENYDDVQEGDLIECYEMEEVKRKLK